MQLFLLKNCVLNFILDDEEKRKPSRSHSWSWNACRNATKICGERERAVEHIRISIWGVPKKMICARNLSRKRQSTTKMLNSVWPESFSSTASHPVEEFSPESPKRSNVILHSWWMVCFICNKPDTNLCAAVVIHACKTAADKQNVKGTTENITSPFLLNFLVDISYWRNWTIKKPVAKAFWTSRHS